MGLLARAYHVQDGKDYANDGLRMNGVCKEVEREVPDCGGWEDHGGHLFQSPDLAFEELRRREGNNLPKISQEVVELGLESSTVGCHSSVLSTEDLLESLCF